MFKISIFLALFSFYGFCQSIEFKEEKYINALQTSVFKNGVLHINEQSIELHYLKSEKSLTFNTEHIIEKKKNETNILSYEDHLELTLFFKIINAIYTSETDGLTDYFEIKKENTTTILIPNEYIANVIRKIEYEKKESKLEFLKIDFTNEDWINIIESK